MLNFAKNMKNMRFHVIFLVAALLSLEACHDANTVFGTWRADKVNVEFDEDKTTPDMIQQVGEMEKNNVIVIAEDSTMTFYSEDDTLQGPVRIGRSGDITFSGKPFGTLKGNIITTESSSILGSITITYTKE